MSEDRKASDLQPIENIGEVYRYFVECSKVLASAMLWVKGQNEVTRTHIAKFSQVEQALYLWAPKDFDIEKFKREILAHNNEAIISVSMPTAQIFFKAKFIHLEQIGFKFHVPYPIYKIQRRKNARFKIPSTHVLRIEFQDPFQPTTVLSKKSIDISAGGLSFETHESDAYLFQPGLILSKIRFEVHRKQIEVDAEIKHSKPLEDTNGKVKVGVEFRNLNSAQQSLIAAYVLEESTKFFAKFVY